MLLYAAFLVIEVSLELARFGFSRDSAKSLVWIVVFGLAGLFALRGLGSDPDAIAKELRSRRRCPSCAFDLRENIPLDGSVTRCPECEACWRFAPQSNHA